MGAKLDQDLEAGTMVDIGGGSTELTSIKGGFDLAKTSIPQGSLSSFANYVAGLMPAQKEVNAIAQAFRELAEKEETDVYHCTQLYGIGGSIRSAAKLYGDLCNNGNRFNYLLPEHIDAILNRYAEDPNAFAHEALRTLPDRIHTLIPGCVIIREAFKLCGGERLDICKYGVREGYLAERVLVKPVSFA